MAPPAAATPQQRPQQAQPFQRSSAKPADPAAGRAFFGAVRQVVYASAPVLRTEKRTAPSASEPEAKRQMQAAGPKRRKSHHR